MALKHVKLPNNSVVDINDARNVVIGDGVNNIVSLTTAQYEALTTKDPNTAYVITDAQEGAGSVVVWGTETSSHTIPLTVNGVTKNVALNGYDAGGGGSCNVEVFSFGSEYYDSFTNLTSLPTGTYDAIAETMAAHKIPIIVLYADDSDSLYSYTFFLADDSREDGFVVFATVSASYNGYILAINSDDTVTIAPLYFESKSNKVTSLSSSSDNIQYPSAKTVYDYAQEKLVSGANIKTINNQSLLGSGNISISGGSGTDNVFIATYGTTTYADVSSAISAGKAIFCKYGSSSYILSQYVGTGNNKHSFVATTSASNSVIDVTWYSVDSTNAWRNTTFSAIEDNSIKTSISSSSTNDDIPSALAAYNFVGSLNTTNATAQTTSASEKLTGTINLHKVAKTGNYDDLLNKPTIPSISGCVSVYGDQTISGDKTIYGRTTYQCASPLWEGRIYRRVNFTEEYLSPWSFIQIIDGQNNDAIIVTLQEALDDKISAVANVTTSLGFNQDFQFAGSAGYTVIGTGGVSKPTGVNFSWISYGQGSGYYSLQQALDAKQNTLVSGTNIKTVNNNSLVGSGNVSIATPGTLNTTATTAQSTSASEALSGSVTLHKIAKTGTFSDLVSKPTTLSGYGITDGQKAITISSSEPTSSQGSNGDIWIVI